MTVKTVKQKRLDRSISRLIKRGKEGVQKSIDTVHLSICNEVQNRALVPNPLIRFEKSGVPIDYEEYMRGRYEPIIKAIERHWRHCGEPVKANTLFDIVTGKPSISVLCSRCGNKKTINGGV
jgi:hypothetical protein